MTWFQLFKLALQDTRRQRSRLFIFSLAISLGVGAVVAIGSLRYDIEDQVKAEAKEILGADLAIKGNFALPDSVLAPFEAAAEGTARERSLASMVRVKGRKARLVNVRAAEGAFPLYGEIEPLSGEPFEAVKTPGKTVISKNLSNQLQIAEGDSLIIGSRTFVVAGIYDKGPGQSGIAATVAPGLYISFEELEATGLITYGSRVRYSYYYKIPKKQELEPLVEAHEKKINLGGSRLITVAANQRQMSSAYENLLRFLNVIGFISLILGSLAISAAITLYLDAKKHTAALLKCLGFTQDQVLKVYVMQIVLVSLVGGLLGALFGVGLQYLISYVSQEFLPVSIPVFLRPGVLSVGLLLGVLITFSIAWGNIRNLAGVTPIRLLRNQAGEAKSIWVRYSGFIGLFVVLFGAAWWLMGTWLMALIYMGALLLTLLLFFGVSRGLILFSAKLSSLSPSYEWKQGVKNLQRPGNQSTLLILSAGLSLFLVLTLSFVRSSVLSYLSLSEEAQRANVVVFDVTEKQRDSLQTILADNNIIVKEELIMVPMRLTSLKNRSTFDWKKDTTADIPMHIFNREYRVTARDELASNETLEKGIWPAPTPASGRAPVSLESRLAQQMGVELGDVLSFNVYGSIVECEVAAVRSVDFTKFQGGFTVVFPSEVIDDAPKSYAYIARSPDDETFAKAQNALLDRFKNLSLIDLNTIRETLQEVLDKVHFAINFMASLSFITALIVLIITLYLTRFQRIKEAVLLRTLGILRRQLNRINFYEFFILGILALFTGLFLSLAAAWSLMFWVFNLPFNPGLEIASLILPGTLLIILVIGVGVNQSILRVPPLEILRREGA
ncbi:ABC transporter permease [bacterium SCSIO 12741]|nr:ABC transporter permease [bacterium SCSIO 12741]